MRANIIEAAGFLAICFVILLRPWKRQVYDGRTMPDGVTYRFSVGDNLLHYDGWKRFRGMSIELPKRMPHIYLDSQKGGGRKADYIIDESQRISLEGNFDEYFQLYAPKSATTLALSIITPDVMQSLLPLAGQYDIELNYDRLNIISAKPVLKSRMRQLEMQHIMTVLLAELGHRMKSWPAGYEASVDDRLILSSLRGTRFFGRYISIKWIVIDVLLLILFVFFALTGASFLLAGSGMISDMVLGTLFSALAVITIWSAYRQNKKFLVSDKFRPDGAWYIRPPKRR